MSEEKVEEVRLSLDDIAACVQIIDLCSKRGAFEGPELEAIGTLRKKLVDFIKTHAPPSEEETEDENN